MKTSLSVFVSLWSGVVCFGGTILEPLIDVDNDVNNDNWMAIKDVIISNQEAIKKAVGLLQSVVEDAKDYKCPEPFFAINSKCYLINEDYLSWEDSEKACQQVGGHLAEPENIFVLLHSLRNRISAGSDKWDDYWYWVAGHKPTGLPWQWESGKPVDDSHWLLDNPHHREGEDCLMFNLKYPPLVDYYCTKEHQSLCQM